MWTTLTSNWRHFFEGRVYTQTTQKLITNYRTIFSLCPRCHLTLFPYCSLGFYCKLYYETLLIRITSNTLSNAIRPIQLCRLEIAYCKNFRTPYESSNGVYGVGMTNYTAHLHELFCISAIQTRSRLSSNLIMLAK